MKFFVFLEEILRKTLGRDPEGSSVRIVQNILKTVSRSMKINHNGVLLGYFKKFSGNSEGAVKEHLISTQEFP